MGAAEDWSELVAEQPAIREAFAAIGTRGGDRRSRARRRAAELDLNGLTLPAIAWELQIAAAEGDARERLAAAYARHRHDALQTAQRAVAEAPLVPAASGGRSAGGGHTAAFVIALIVAFLSPALVMPRFRGGGFVYDVDQVALLSGAVSLVLAVVGLVYVRRASRPLFGAAIPAILGIWVVIAAVVAVIRLGQEPALASPGAIAGIVLMGVAALVHGLSALARRSPRAVAAAQHGAPDRTTEALAEALAGEPEDAAHLRRASYADAVQTLMKRGELDRYDAEHLLREYAG